MFGASSNRLRIELLCTSSGTALVLKHDPYGSRGLRGAIRAANGLAFRQDAVLIAVGQIVAQAGANLDLVRRSGVRSIADCQEQQNSCEEETCHGGSTNEV